MIRAKLIELTRYSQPWDEAWLSRFDGVIQRAGSQGGKDSRYDEFHPHVMRFPARMAYWYFGSATPWRKQADDFIAIIGGDFKVVACDFETATNEMSAAFVSSAIEFMLYLKSKGYTPILYTNQDVYNTWIAPCEKARAAQFPLWFSWPPPDSILPLMDTYGPPTPSAHKDWIIWQYLYGEHDVTGCEQDVFNGNRDALIEFAGGSNDQQPTPPPSPKTAYTGTLKTNMYVRVQMNTSSAIIGGAGVGQIVTGQSITRANGYDWLAISTPAQFAGRYIACGPAADPRQFIDIKQETNPDPAPTLEARITKAETRLDVLEKIVEDLQAGK